MSLALAGQFQQILKFKVGVHPVDPYYELPSGPGAPPGRSIIPLSLFFRNWFELPHDELEQTVRDPHCQDANHTPPTRRRRVWQRRPGLDAKQIECFFHHGLQPHHMAPSPLDDGVAGILGWVGAWSAKLPHC